MGACLSPVPIWHQLVLNSIFGPQLFGVGVLRVICQGWPWISSFSRRENSLRMHHYIWMISFVREEQGYSCCCTWSIIVGEFHKGKKFGPIILLVVVVQTDVLFQCLVMHSVCLSPSGWYPEVKWSFILRAFPKDLKKCDMNSILWSEVTCDGTPCFEKTCVWRAGWVAWKWWCHKSE